MGSENRISSVGLRSIFMTFLAVAFVVSGFFVANLTQAATVTSQVSHYTYYTKDNGTFARSLTPVNVASGSFSISQVANSDGSVTASFSGVTGYADSGFYVDAGTLGNLNSVIVKAASGSDPFGLNIWFDKDNDGEFFNWNGDTYTGTGGDAYILGQGSQNGVFVVNDNTSFTSLTGGGNYTLAQLKNGNATGITDSTRIALWIGVSPSGSKSATIQLLEINPPIWVDSSWNSNSAGDIVGDGKIFGTNAFSKIQDAVNAASSGDTINVAAGTYTEQVVITKNLTLRGADASTTTIQAPATLTGDSNSYKNIVTIGGGATVEFSGFTVNGPGPSDCSLNTGIFVRDGATANIHDNTISNIQDNPFSGCQNGVGIFVGKKAFSTTGTATISANTITNYQKGGIVVDNTGSGATISGNTVTGVGPTVLIAQNGIQISRGATGTITNNHISANDYTSSGNNSSGQPEALCNGDGSGLSAADKVTFSNDCWTSAGLLLYQASETTVTGNTISGSQIGVYADTNGKPVNQNNISGSQLFGFQADGVVVDATQNYWGDVYPDFSTIVVGSVSYNPWFTDSALTKLSSASSSPFITTYTIDNPVFSPNGDGVKDTATVDWAFVKPLKANADILDASGVKVKDLYYTSVPVQNPNPKIWDGKDNSGTVVPDGTYPIKIILTDSVGNSFVDTSKTVVVDDTKPVITLNGKATVNMYVGGVFNDPGAMALDSHDGDISRNVTKDSLDTSIAGTYVLKYNVSDAAGNAADSVTRTVIVKPVSGTQQPLLSNTSMTSDKPTVLVGENNTSASVVNVPADVNNAQIDASLLITGTDTKEVTLGGGLTLNSTTSAGNVTVQIPTGAKITASSSWTGVINAPQVKSNDSVAVIPDPGSRATVNSVVEIGFADTRLTFDKAVRILLTGQTGKLVGYSRSGTFTPITAVCSGDSQTVGDALAAGDNCKFDNSSDLIVWTKHFTNFVTYTQAPIPSVNGGGGIISGGGGGGGGGGYYYSAPTPTPSISPVTSVGILNFNTLMVNWGNTSPNNAADFNGDGKVDILDFNWLMIHWTS